MAAPARSWTLTSNNAPLESRAGLVASRTIKPNEVIWERRFDPVQGNRLSHIQVQELGDDIRERWLAHAWQVTADLMEGLPVGSEERFVFWAEVRHSCDPSAWLESFDSSVITARREIQAGQPVTLDFGTFMTKYPLGDCTCGETSCRRTLSNTEWKNADFQKRYQGHFMPYVQRLVADGERSASAAALAPKVPVVTNMGPPAAVSSKRVTDQQEAVPEIEEPEGSTPVSLRGRQKVPLKPGFSPLDWARFSRSRDLSGTGGRTARVPMSEVAKHNTVEDAWVVIRGKVYNMTPYFEYHPGGVVQLKRVMGKDGTALFEEKHAWISADNIMPTCLIGNLLPE